MAFLHLGLLPDHNNFRKFIMGYYLPKSLAFKKLFPDLLFCFQSFSHSSRADIMS